MRQTRTVDFSLSLAMCPPDRLIPMAQLAERVGWDSVTVPDSVFFPEQVSGEYPFTDDGQRFWTAETPFVGAVTSAEGSRVAPPVPVPLPAVPGVLAPPTFGFRSGGSQPPSAPWNQPSPGDPAVVGIV